MMARDLLTGPEPEDIMPTDWVMKRGLKQKGVVESISGTCAVVDWLTGAKEIVEVRLLVKVPHRAASFDRRFVR